MAPSAVRLPPEPSDSEAADGEFATRDWLHRGGVERASELSEWARTNVQSCAAFAPARPDVSAVDTLRAAEAQLVRALDGSVAGKLQLGHVRRLLRRFDEGSAGGRLHAVDKAVANVAASAWLRHPEIERALNAPYQPSFTRVTSELLAEEARVDLAAQHSRTAAGPLGDAARARLQRRLASVAVTVRHSRGDTCAEGGGHERASASAAAAAAHHGGEAPAASVLLGPGLSAIGSLAAESIRQVYPSPRHDERLDRPHANEEDMWYRGCPYREQLLAAHGQEALYRMVPAPVPPDTDDARRARVEAAESYYADAVATTPPEGRELIVRPTVFDRGPIYNGYAAYTLHRRNPCGRCRLGVCEIGAMLMALSSPTACHYRPASYERQRAAAAVQPGREYRPDSMRAAIDAHNINLTDFAKGHLRWVGSMTERGILFSSGLRSAQFVVYTWSFGASVFDRVPGLTDIERAAALSHDIITAANGGGGGDASGVSAGRLADALNDRATDVSPRVVQDMRGPLNDQSCWWPFMLPMLLAILAKLHAGGYAFVLDIKGGYPHLLLMAAAVYMFATTLGGREALRTRLALGFLLAPAIFCSLTGEALLCVMRILLATNPRAVLVDLAALACYIDDFIGGARTRESALALLATLRAYLSAVGFTESMKKAQFGQILKILGVMIDLSTCRAYLPLDKARKLLLLVSLVKACAMRHVKGGVKHLLRKLAGSLSAVCSVVPAGRLHMAPLHVYAADGKSVGGVPWVSEELLRVLDWWALRLADVDTHSRLVPIGASASADTLVQVRVDASRNDEGGGFGLHVGELSLHGRFRDDSLLDIAPREAVAAEFLADNAGEWLAGLTVAWGTDSRNSFVAISRGRADSAALAAIVSSAVTRLHGIGADIYAIWVCREANGWADALAGALTLEAAIVITRRWHARVREVLAH
jgi:hypothetical protein